MRGITRREVVAGGTGTLLLQPGTVFSAAANSTVGVGIIGTGDRGQYAVSYTHLSLRSLKAVAAHRQSSHNQTRECFDTARRQRSQNLLPRERDVYKRQV